MNRYALPFLNRQHSTTLATLVTLDHFTLLECLQALPYHHQDKLWVKISQFLSAFARIL
jgi:hypothetical protein